MTDAECTDRDIANRVRKLYALWSGPEGVVRVDLSTIDGRAYATAWRECTVVLGAALELIDIDNPITPGEDS